MARTGSFSAAARELGCTQPAVSQQMKALEGAAGTPLLVRGAREMRLTEAGEVLVRHAAGILAGLTAAEEEVAAIAGLRAGRVRLASFPSGSSTLVPAAVADLRARHPDTRVSLVEAEPPRSVEMLRAGDCDITLAFRYVDLPTPAEESWSDLVVRPLFTDRLVGLVPEGHRLAKAGTQTGAEPGVGTESGAPTAAVADTRAAAGPHGSRAGGAPVPYAELAAEQWIAGCPRCRRHLVEVCERVGFTPGSTSRPTTTRRWSAWSPPVWAWPCCPNSPSRRCGPTGWPCWRWPPRWSARSWRSPSPTSPTYRRWT